jgi:molybdopterin molybdotransferase
MISVEAALEQILAQIQPLPIISLPLADALDYVLAEDIVARAPVPPFANSAMDGYALRSADTTGAREEAPARLRVIGTIPAGYMAEYELKPGTAMRIMTGAPVPPGADAVIQHELTRQPASDANSVEILTEVVPGNNIRAAGEDIQPGSRVLSTGSVLGPWELAVLASIGVASVQVYRRARVAVIATGDEVVEVGQPLQAGQIYNSNSYTIAAAVTRAGGIAHVLGIAHDVTGDLREKLSMAREDDLIITTGGVSVGDFDLVKDLLAEQGKIEFWRINMRPGKPVAFGHIGMTPLLGLPGNPVSAAVTFELLGRPALRKMMGHRYLQRQVVPVTMLEDITDRSMRRHYVRAKVEFRDGRFWARTTGPQGSHIMTSMLGANALLIVPEGGTIIHAGDEVQAIMLEWPEK